MPRLGEMADIDNIDLRLLRLLAGDSKVSLKKMAREVGLSITGVNKRIERLEKNGVIKQYSAIIDPKKLGYGVSAFVRVAASPSGMDDLVRALRNKHEVCEMHKVTGERQLMMKVRARDQESLNRFIEENISGRDGVRHVTTTMAMATFKETLLNP
ncbi:MAG: Lrp/AsnC family transcriptional regulator [Candidatus Hadarchaeota archaeon]